MHTPVEDSKIATYLGTWHATSSVDFFCKRFAVTGTGYPFSGDDIASYSK